MRKSRPDPKKRPDEGVALPWCCQQYSFQPGSALIMEIYKVSIIFNSLAHCQFQNKISPVDQLVQLKVIVVFSKWIVERVGNPETFELNQNS